MNTLTTGDPDSKITLWLSKVILDTTQTELIMNETEHQSGPCLTLSSSNSLSDISLNQNITRKCRSHTPASQYFASSWTALSYRALRPPCSCDFSEPGSMCMMCVCVCVFVHTVGTRAHKVGDWLKGSFS